MNMLLGFIWCLALFYPLVFLLFMIPLLNFCIAQNVFYSDVIVLLFLVYICRLFSRKHVVTLVIKVLYKLSSLSSLYKIFLKIQRLCQTNVLVSPFFIPDIEQSD